MAVKMNKVWSLEKYARFVPDVTSACTKTAGQWQVPVVCNIQIHLALFCFVCIKHYPSKDMKMQLSLLDSEHIVVSCGAKIHVRFVVGSVYLYNVCGQYPAYFRLSNYGPVPVSLGIRH